MLKTDELQIHSRL